MFDTSIQQRARSPGLYGAGEAGAVVRDAPVDPRVGDERPDVPAGSASARSLEDSLAEERHRRWCNVRRVLLVRVDGVAGVLASSAAFAAIHETMPWAQLTLLTAPEAVALRPHLDVVDDVMPFNAPWTAAGAAVLGAEPSTMRGDAEMHLVRKLRRSHFDAAVVFSADAASALPAAMLCRMAGIPLALAAAREPVHGLLSDAWPDDGLLQDDARRQLALVAHVGLHTVDDRPRFKPLAKDHQEARQALRQAGVAADRRYVLVCPGGEAARPGGPAVFGAAADTLLQAWGDDTAVVLCAHPGGEAALREVQAAMRVPGHLLPQAPSLGEFAALAAGARVLIAADDVTLTLAAAAGVPAVLPGDALRRERPHA